MEKIELKTAMAQLRAAVQRDTSATDVELIDLKVALFGIDGDFERKTDVATFAFAVLDEYCANPNKYLP